MRYPIGMSHPSPLPPLARVLPAKHKTTEGNTRDDGYDEAPHISTRKMDGASDCLLAAVVRSFYDHLHIVRVRFLQTGSGNTHKLATSLELIDRERANVHHRLTQTAHQLMRNRPQWTTVGNLPLDALWNQLLIA